MEATNGVTGTVVGTPVTGVEGVAGIAGGSIRTRVRSVAAVAVLRLFCIINIR